MMRDRAAAQRHLDSDTLAPHIVFLGRFVKRKGADILLDAIEYGEHASPFPPAPMSRWPAKARCLRHADIGPQDSTTGHVHRIH